MSSRKITKNTVVLLARQFVMVLISLYTVRVLISEFGINDFGLLTVLISTVGLCAFITDSLGMITRRYISFGIGRGDSIDLKRFHDACFILNILCAVLIVLLLQTIGAWFVSSRLIVPTTRIDATQIIYQFLVMSFVVGIFFSFYSSVIAGHEDFHIFALFSILSAVLRLAAALLVGTLGGDALITYGPLILTAGVIVMVIQVLYCTRRYEECKLNHIKFDAKTMREMLDFAGWTAFGQFTSICRTQAITVLINQAYNPATVAARALSFTIHSQVLNFSQNFSSVLDPAIIGAYAAKENERKLSLIYFGSRLSFFLSWIVTLPLIALTPGVLDLWLGTYPNETVLFTRLALIEGLIIAISFPLMTAVRAVGEVRNYEIILGSFQIGILLFSWIMVKSGFPTYSIFILSIVINFLMFFVRLLLVAKLTDLSIFFYTRNTIIPVALVVGASSALSWSALHVFLNANTFELQFESIVGIFLILLLPTLAVLLLGLSRAEQRYLYRTILSRFNKMGE